MSNKYKGITVTVHNWCRQANLRFFIYLLIIIFFPIFIDSNDAFAGKYIVQEVQNVDTIILADHTITLKVRLIGIYNPTISNSSSMSEQSFSQEAKRFLEKLILKKQVTVKGYGIMDDENRPLVVIFLKDMNVNLELLKNGLARYQLAKPIEGFKPKSFLAAEDEAKKDKKGIWGLEKNQ